MKRLLFVPMLLTKVRSSTDFGLSKHWGFLQVFRFYPNSIQNFLFHSITLTIPFSAKKDTIKCQIANWQYIPAALIWMLRHYLHEEEIMYYTHRSNDFYYSLSIPYIINLTSTLKLGNFLENRRNTPEETEIGKGRGKILTLHAYKPW